MTTKTQREQRLREALGAALDAIEARWHADTTRQGDFAAMPPAALDAGRRLLDELQDEAPLIATAEDLHALKVEAIRAGEPADSLAESLDDVSELAAVVCSHEHTPHLWTAIADLRKELESRGIDCSQEEESSAREFSAWMVGACGTHTIHGECWAIGVNGPRFYIVGEDPEVGGAATTLAATLGGVR